MDKLFLAHYYSCFHSLQQSMFHSLTTFFIYATLFKADNNMPETVLIEDDEESVQNSLAGAMGGEGYEVVTVASARWIGDQKPLEVTE
jgi:hypothetical protein